jgi:TM2 domain-containing membrane protein YozV
MFTLFPELASLDMQEMNVISNLIKDLDEASQENFAMLYRHQRKDPQTMLIMSIVGLIAVPGLQRFMLNQIGMGILYLFTAGLCFIGSIIDLVKSKEMTLEYNTKVAMDIMMMLRRDTGNTSV